MDSAYSELCRVCVCVCVVLSVLCVSDAFILYTDTAGWGISACLHIVRDGIELAVSFFSHQLR